MKKNQPQQDSQKEPTVENAQKAGGPTAADPDQAPPVTSDPQSEIEKYRDQALRSAADLENYRKRMIREKEEAVRFANAGLFEKLLPILDNFELGLEAARGDASAKSIVDGFSMVHRQLGDFLQASGLQIIEAVGQPFDPKFHEALGHESDPSQADGVVLRQPRRGYRLADRLIRPASVIVNKIS